MHILQITPRYIPNIGGVETVVQKVSETLVARGIQVTIYSVDLNPNLPRTENINGVLVKRFIPVLGDPLYLPELRFITALRREKADLIHVHNIHILPPLLVASFKRRNQKLLLQPHYHRFGQSSLRHSLLMLYRQIVNNIVFPRADLVLANSQYERKILCKDFSKCANLVLIPEGMDVGEVKNVKHNPSEPKRVLYVGALKGYKNIDKLLRGFAWLTKNEKTAFKLVIIGNGSEHNSLVRLANDLGISSSIEWKHDLSREQLLGEYAEASIFVLLSQLESFSRVVYDALLIGVPTVVLSFGPLEDLVKSGLVEGVDSLDPKEIGDALIRVTRKTYTKITTTSKNFLYWKEYSNRIIRVYHNLLEKK